MGREEDREQGCIWSKYITHMYESGVMKHIIMYN